MAEPQEKPAGNETRQEPQLHEGWERLLGEHVEAAKGVPEAEAKERLREAIRERIEAARPAPVPPVAPAEAVPGAAPAAAPKIEPKELKRMPEERQVYYLAQLALTEGLEKSVSLAEHLNSPYVLDEFHDLLVDRLWQELISRGIIKPSV